MKSTLSNGPTRDTTIRTKIMIGVLSGIVFWLVYEGISSLLMIMGWI